MVEVVEIIVLVFGVLQIILFFKIWGMTNDVKKLVGKTNEWDIRKTILIGDKEEIKKAIINQIATEIIDKTSNNYQFDKVQDILKKYKSLIDKYGIDIPEAMTNAKTASDVIKLL